MQKDDSRNHIFNLCLQHAQNVGWADFTLHDAAHMCDLPLVEVLCVFPHKKALLKEHFRRLDKRMLRDFQEEGSALKEIFFELIMLRLEHMWPQKKLIQSVYQAAKLDPFLGLFLFQQQSRTVHWMLIQGRCSFPSFPAESLCHKTLWALYTLTVKQWLQEPDVDLPKTMAFLDKGLAKTSFVFQIFSQKTRKEIDAQTEFEENGGECVTHE